MKEKLDNLTVTQIAFIGYTLNGIAWIASAITLLLTFFSVLSDVFSVIAIISQCALFLLVLPNDKMDEMAEVNLRKAESKSLHGIKYSVLLILVIFATWLLITHPAKMIPLEVLGAAIISISIGMLGIANFLTGLYLYRFEKE